MKHLTIRSSRGRRFAAPLSSSVMHREGDEGSVR
jgi:hypothetical protein